MSGELWVFAAIEAAMVVAFVFALTVDNRRSRILRRCARAGDQQEFLEDLREYMDRQLAGASTMEEISYFHHVHVPMVRETAGSMERHTFLGSFSLVIGLVFLLAYLGLLFYISAYVTGGREWYFLLLLVLSGGSIYFGVTGFCVRAEKKGLKILQRVDQRIIDYLGGQEPPPCKTAFKDIAMKMEAESVRTVRPWHDRQLHTLPFHRTRESHMKQDPRPPEPGQVPE